jgi:ASC-1-like (ASCH) protein
MVYIPPKKAMMNLDINAPTTGGFESVGQSLLAQKRADERSAAKKDKREEALMQGLTLLTFGSSMYRGQTAKRAQELEAAQAFSLGNVKSRVNAIKTVASLNQMTRGKSYEQILADPNTFDNTKAVLRPLITEQMKSRFSEQRYDELAATTVDSLETRATKNILENLLKRDGKATSRLEGVALEMFGHDTLLHKGERVYKGSKLFQGSSEEEKLAYALNLTPEAFEGDMKRKYANHLNKLQTSDGVFSIDNFLNFMPFIKGREGSVNIFRSIGNEDSVLGKGTLQMMIDATKIQTDIVPIIQDAIVANASQDYSSAVAANGDSPETKEGIAVINIKNAIIKEDDIDDANVNALGAYVSTMAITDDMEEILQEIDSDIFDEGGGTIKKDSAQARPLTQDAAALYLRLSEEREQQFAEQLYMPSAHAEALRDGYEAGTDAYEAYVKNRVKKFAVDIRKPEYADQRAKFSLLLALRVGAVEKQAGSGPRQLFFEGAAGYTYNSGRVKSLLKPALAFQEGEGYSQDSGWQYLSGMQKMNILFLEVDEIQQSGATTEQKEQLLKNLIDNVAVNEFNSVGEFIQKYEIWKPIWQRQANHFQLYGQLSEGNRAAQLQQRLFGNEIDKHFGWKASRGSSGQRKQFIDDKFQEIQTDTGRLF